MKIRLLFISCMILLLSCKHENKEETKSPILGKQDSLYVFNFAGQKLALNPKGGRITSFQLDSQEIIGPGGSTFWVSPQSYWSWPPIKQHHEDVYEAQIKGDTLELKSKKDDLLHLEIIKIIFSNNADTSFTVRYGIHNSGDSVINIAPWENTRTFKNALLFYPKGSTDSTASNPVFGKLMLTNAEGLNWFAFDSSRVQEKNMGKLFADGAEGWIGEANNGLILIKKFQDLSMESQAPGEGEIEIFADLENPFMEMEEQGPLKKLEPGKTLWWEVKWKLRKIPKGVEVKEGSSGLSNFVKSLIH